MPDLRHKDGEYFFLCTFDERDIAKDAKFKWNNKRKCWTTTNVEYAKTLFQYGDLKTKAAIDVRQQSYELSFAEDSDLEIPCPDGLAYLPYQKAGIAWCIDRDVSLIADQPGLGKTIQAIGVANYQKKTPSILIVCPATLKIHWQRELAKWCMFDSDSYIVKGRKDIIPFWEDIIIINYDLLTGKEIVDQLSTREFDIGIFDEIHYCKSYKAKRTKAVFQNRVGLARNCKKNIFLTGTPVLNRPMELYALLSAMSPGTIKPYDNWKSYAYRFCKAWSSPWGFDTSGSSNEEDLNKRLRGTIMIRRLKKDVLKQLPEKRPPQIIVFEQDAKTRKILRKEKEIDRSELQKQKLRHATKKDLKGNPIRLSLGDIAIVRQEMAEAKLPLCVIHIKDLLEQDIDKLLIFAHHQAIIAALATALKKYNPVTLTGATSQKKRWEAIDKFQTDLECRVFVGNVKAAGEGITLTAAHFVVFVEFSWVPGEIEQDVDRVHRIGQTKEVSTQFLVVRDSIEEHMLKTVVDKEEKITSILDVNHGGK